MLCQTENNFLLCVWMCVRYNGYVRSCPAWSQHVLNPHVKSFHTALLDGVCPALLVLHYIHRHIHRHMLGKCKVYWCVVNSWGIYTISCFLGAFFQEWQCRDTEKWRERERQAVHRPYGICSPAHPSEPNRCPSSLCKKNWNCTNWGQTQN